MLAASSTPHSVRKELMRMGYTLEFEERTSRPINAILFDRKTPIALGWIIEPR